jgi:hypothetical protein
MDCRQIAQYLDGLLAVEPDESVRSKVEAHCSACPACAREYELARRALALLETSQEVTVSSNLKERIMNAIVEHDVVSSRRSAIDRRGGKLRRLAWVAGLAALVLILAALYQWLGRTGPGRESEGYRHGLGLLSPAWATEEALFNKKGIVHLVSEIVVRPVSDPNVARMRWIPVVSLDAKGTLRFDQLRLPAKPGEGFTVVDEISYDSQRGEFSRIMTLGGKPVFGNSFDGEAVYSLELESSAKMRVTRTPIASDFKAPQSPAEFLGLTSGVPTELNKNDKSMLSEAGEVTLSDGSKGRLIKAAIRLGGAADTLITSYWLFTIREADNTIVQKEWFVGKQSVLAIRRVRVESIGHPVVAWNLSGIEGESAPLQAAAGVGVTPDAVVPDVSVQDVVDKAHFETYIFSVAPPWAKERKISDVLDVASPPHRMFSITYKAKDGRHVVLVQSYTFNTGLGPKAKTGKVLYQSPAGFKVWSGAMDRLIAGILLQSAGYGITEPLSEDRTGYILESPAGTFPALAINGKISDDELRALMNSLVPTKEYRGN